MKLEAGKWYKTRDGRKAFVGFIHPNRTINRYIGSIDSEALLSWSEYGEYGGQSSSPVDLVSEWTEPTFRPFRMDEVPLGALVTMEGKTGRYAIIGAEKDGLLIAWLGCIGYEQARNKCKLSTDGGVTWKPCGVLEGGE